VTRRRIMLLAATYTLSLAASGMVSLRPSPADAQNSCSSGCKAAYGNCYKSTHDRGKCQVQLQRCLEGCIRGKRQHAAGQTIPQRSAPEPSTPR
jgi:hypothetical protein